MRPAAPRLFFLGANPSLRLYPGCSRLDCGTGPGLVRSRHRVQLRAWNHLAVFRHDWAVWLQLNRGRREEGRSQVRTLGWAADDILNLGFKSQYHKVSIQTLYECCIFTAAR